MELGEIDIKIHKKIVTDYDELKKYVDAHRVLKHRIVCTIGSFDMLHIGHVRYLLKAKQSGDILVVGADSDPAIKRYKGEERPIIPLEERMEMLAYQVPVDLVTVIEDVDEKGNWQFGLLKAIKPDVYIAVEDSYPPEQIAEIKKHCKELKVLPRQATTSTSHTIEKAVKIRGSRVLERLKNAITDVETILEGNKKCPN
ncbi:MAG: adenylyltransferase/cytidyltransferase family protein [Candidatus Aenigmarchaeota archaeon]|nr:adenylyltransferase/cytidyltransferase family protein [Candidatus Aenigmarchaeota archaeon]